MIGFLKVISVRPPILLIKCNNAKLCTKGSKTLPQVDPINMSYTSYEVTEKLTRDPLVVMHGLFGSKRNWNTLCKLFQQKTSPQRRIIAVDARNHGESPHHSAHSYPHLAEDIKALLMQLNIKKAALLGHSMGGRAIMYFGLRYPELVDKLIVSDVSPISTSPNLTSMSSIFAAMKKVILPRDVPIADARVTTDSQLSKNMTDKSLRAFLLTNLGQQPDGSYAWRVNIPALVTNFTEHIARFPDVSGLQFNGPVLFVAGGESDFVPKSDYSEISKLFPKAEFRVIEGAGHWLHSDKPNEFLQICTEFLNKTVEGS